MPADRWRSWGAAIGVTGFAAALRFFRIGAPHGILFDETYYAKDAWSILRHGVEWNMVANPPGWQGGTSYADTLMLAGNTHIIAACTPPGCGEWVVHPEVGKYLIAVGEATFGLTPLGWRVMSAVFGSLAILLMCRIARRLTRSTLLGCIAGLLLSLDGLEFVLSRTGILDIFLMFFVLAAFGALLIDRDISRARLATVVMSNGGSGTGGASSARAAGPGLGIRRWRVAAGLLIGLACATKQDAVWYIPAFAALAVGWDLGARRTAGLRRPWRGALLRDGTWLLLTLGVIPLAVYIASWSNWLITSTGYYRDYGTTHGVSTPVISELYSLFEYHVTSIDWGIHLTSHHNYESQPWGWVVLSRPVDFYFQCYTGPTAAHVCPATGYTGPRWYAEVTALGNPAIWWVSIPAMVFCLAWWLKRRDWRAGTALLCVAAGWLPWMPLLARTKFSYYALEFEPFVILCVTLCLGLIIGPAVGRPRHRVIGAAVAGTYVLAVLVLFWYFYPLLSGQLMPYQDWQAHMWYYGWILRGPYSMA